MKNYPKPWKELHVSREARDKYQIDDTIFAENGDAIFIDFHAARRFAQQLNQKRNVTEFPEHAVSAGDINAIGLIHEIFHFIIDLFMEEKNASAFQEALNAIIQKNGYEPVQSILRTFTDNFPPVRVYQREIGVEAFLHEKTGKQSNRQVMLEELILLYLANQNPALAEYNELFDDTDLERSTNYNKIIYDLDEFFDSQPNFGPEEEQLIDMLRSPAEEVPHSISGQLEWISEHWGHLLGKYFYRLLRSLDLIKEETRARFTGKGPSHVYEFGGEVDVERFSEDKDWMPKIVILAKNIYVWMDQLSRKYQRAIQTIDQIPDEELEILARRGFTGLWLIGVWERSEASRRIKQLCGNPEAVASAYSLYDYVIASDLGGEKAFQNLRKRARDKGIRMAGDMVPNHVGIDGKWMIEHPDWFISLDQSPFPMYSFNGPDLSPDERVGIFIEDHYYDRSDAAVVFKRLDRWTGDEKYIYHGNDGTSMPWNDTAQLNYLKEEVREAVIQTILHVARNFSIIRFDAAMTLAKKHYQRLWFPEPGTGGDIATRAEHGMTREEFDNAFPREFWREVVDRVAEEEPDTLLLAEAFWLMEGYFVRTLGMHRVYNSAFMNMLKTEENAKYRQSIKNVLEFNPEILKRFVNFMNNPDEETAVAQFGKSDKYFGVCVLMVTMPGLPMFGHGQVEGFTEKYGMEYKKAYWDEQPDEQLVRRHEREIFPLLHKRRLFAEVENFRLYDFYSNTGGVNENVFAYSNKVDGKKSLVLYNNKYEQATGWIKRSAAFTAKSGDDERSLKQTELAPDLGLHNDGQYYTIFRDSISGLEYIRNSKGLHDQGLYAELGAFKYHVFLDFREVQDVDGQYAELTHYLNGRGVPNIQEALREVTLQPIHHPARNLMNKEMYNRVVETPKKDQPEDLWDTIHSRMASFFNETKRFTGAQQEIAPPIEKTKESLKAVRRMTKPAEYFDPEYSEEVKEAIATIEDYCKTHNENRPILYAWAVTHQIGQIADSHDIPGRSRSWIDELRFDQVYEEFFGEMGFDSGKTAASIDLIKLLTGNQYWFMDDFSAPNVAYRLMDSMINDEDVRRFLDINRHRDVLWFNKESFQELQDWLVILAGLDVIRKGDTSERTKVLAKRVEIINRLRSAEMASEYKLEKLLDHLKVE